MRDLGAADVPASAGVYALYRGGRRMYVGKAKSLRDRVWKNHSGRGLGMSTSAMRRNVAEHLGLATADEIKKRVYRASQPEAQRVRDWLDDCEIAWRECASETEAAALEKAMKDEYLPPLTKR
jgi:excinuclease UvrABC nuclease subunit